MGRFSGVFTGSGMGVRLKHSVSMRKNIQMGQKI